MDDQQQLFNAEAVAAGFDIGNRVSRTGHFAGRHGTVVGYDRDNRGQLLIRVHLDSDRDDQAFCYDTNILQPLPAGA